MGWVINHMPRPLYPREWPSTHCTGYWVGTTACLAFTGIQSPGGPTHSNLLYRLSYLYEEECEYIYNLKCGLLCIWFVLNVSEIILASLFRLVANLTVLIYLGLLIKCTVPRACAPPPNTHTQTQTQTGTHIHVITTVDLALCDILKVPHFVCPT